MRSATKSRLAKAPEAALDELSEVLNAIPAADVVRVNLDVPRAVRSISRSLLRARTLERRIATELPLFDLSLLDKLSDYASALSQAHALYNAVETPAPPGKETLRQAREVRMLLCDSAQLLVLHGVIGDGQLDKLASPNGYTNVAQNLELLVAIHKRVWSKLQGKTLLTLDELDAALTLAASLRDTSVPGLAHLTAANDLRARAFTLTLRAYREMRRAVCYLRGPEGDAEAYVPNLYAGRR